MMEHKTAVLEPASNHTPATGSAPAVPSRAPRTRPSNGRLGSRVPARWRIAGWILLTTALTLLAVLLTVRSLMVNQARTQAHQAISQELQEFRAFAKEGVDPTTAKPFTSIEKMLERYLSRQSAASGEVILGSVGPRVLYTPSGAMSSADTGHRLPADTELLHSIRSGPDATGIAATSAGEMHWARLPIQSGTDTGYLIVGDYMAPREAQVATTTVTIFFVSLGGLAVTAGIAWFVAARFSVRSVKFAAWRRISLSPT